MDRKHYIKRASDEKMLSTCPKCSRSFSNPESECPYCQIIFKKYFEIIKREKNILEKRNARKIKWKSYFQSINREFDKNFIRNYGILKNKIVNVLADVFFKFKSGSKIKK